MKRCRREVFLLFGMFVSMEISAMTVQNYLDEVKKNHHGIKASLKKSNGAKMRRDEISLLFSPNLFSTYQRADDKRYNPMATLQVKETIDQSFTFGVASQYRFGLQTKASYKTEDTTLKGINPAQLHAYAQQGLPIATKFYQNALTIELTQPLWKNGFGSEFRLEESQAKQGTDSASYADLFAARMTLIQAENAYWRLACAQRQIKVEEESYDRTRKLMEWQKKRAKDNLSDQADLLSAQAALKGKQIAVSNVVNEIRLAQKEVNEFLGRAPSLPLETTIPFTTKKLLAAAPPKPATERDDVKAMRLGLAAKEDGAMLGKAKYDPSFDVFAQAMMTGMDRTRKDATKASFTNKTPLYVVGVNFSMPLNFGIVNSTRRGYLEEIEGTKLDLEQKKRDVANEWSELNQRLVDAKETLRLVNQLAKLQNEKFTAEHARLKQGRTTTFQMFLVEQDLLDAQDNQIKATAQVLAILTMMKAHEDTIL